MPGSDEQGPLIRIWLLRLIPSFGYARVAIGLSISVVLLLSFWITGVLDGSGQPHASSEGAVFFAVILGYIVPVYHYIIARTKDAFDELAESLAGDADDIAVWRRSISKKSVSSTVVTLTLGVLAGLAHNVLIYGSPMVFISRISSNSAMLTNSAATMLVWVVMTTVVGSLSSNARLFGRLASVTEFSLLNTTKLTPFSRVAVSSTLALIGAQAAFPILWLGPDVDAVAVTPGLVATFAPMLYVFWLPIWRIHREIVARKQRELARVSAAIGAAPSVDLASDESVARVSALLGYRRELSQVHEWPFDLNVAMRLGFYLIIPPLTWVGAALIEKLVETFL